MEALGGIKVSLREAAGPPTQTHGPEASEGPAQAVSYRPRPHVLCIFELLLLVVVPLGQDVEQQQVTENRGLGAGWGEVGRVWEIWGQGQSPPHPLGPAEGESCPI